VAFLLLSISKHPKKLYSSCTNDRCRINEQMMYEECGFMGNNVGEFDGNF
jgi:hypothetical protein